MTQYRTLNVKLPNLPLIKLKSGTKNVSEVTLNLPSNFIQNFDDKLFFRINNC